MGTLALRRQNTDPASVLVFLETCAESISPGEALSTKMTENISAMLHRAAKNGQLSILEKFRDLSALSSRGLWDLSYAIDLATSCQVFPEDGKLMKYLEDAPLLENI